MQRGTEKEPVGCRAYELQYNINANEVGFITVTFLAFSPTAFVLSEGFAISTKN